MATLRFDTYVSYHQQDQRWVEGYLLPHLHMGDFRVATQDRVVTLSEPFWVSIERAITISRFLLAVVSPLWMANEWVDLERFFRRTGKTDLHRLVLLQLHRVKLPEALQSCPSIDFTNEEQWKEQMKHLLLLLMETNQTESEYSS